MGGNIFLHNASPGNADQGIYDAVLNSPKVSVFDKRLFVLRNSSVSGLFSLLSSGTIFDEQDRTFYLGCVNLYREVVQTVCKRLSGVCFPATPACVTIIGSIYAERFLRCLRPSLDSMAQSTTVGDSVFYSLHIFCDQEDHRLPIERKAEA